MAESSNKERRVDIKTLENKIDNLSLTLDKAIARWDKSADQIIINQINIAKMETGQRAVCEDVDALETKVNGWNSLNSMGVVIAGIVAAFGAWLSGR